LLAGLVIGTAATLGIVGARGTRTEEAKGVVGPAADQPSAKVRTAGEDAGRFKTVGMTRHQFRQKLMKCQGASGTYWDGINRRPGEYAYPLLRKDFDLTFGKPKRTQLIDKAVDWYYRCSDGEIQLILEYRPPSQGKMLFLHVDGRDRRQGSVLVLPVQRRGFALSPCRQRTVAGSG
jgi:hypothetical protein